MDDLVGVAAQQEAPRVAQGLEDQQQLDIGEVLHLVHHHEVVAGCDPRQPGVAQDVGVEPALLVEELQVALEQVIDRPAQFARIDGLAYPQGQVALAIEIGPVLGGAGDGPLDLLEQPVAVLQFLGQALA